MKRSSSFALKSYGGTEKGQLTRPTSFPWPQGDTSAAANEGSRYRRRQCTRLLQAAFYRSPKYALLLFGVVAVADDGNGLDRALQFGDVAGGKREIERVQVLVEIRRFRCAGNRDDERCLGEKPRERDLRGRHAARAPKPLQHVHDARVEAQRLRLEAGMKGQRLENEEADLLKRARPTKKFESRFAECRSSFLRRMWNSSAFMRTFRQRFTMSFNGRRDHRGTMFEGRYHERNHKPEPEIMWKSVKGAQGRRRPHRGRAVLQRREAVLRRGTHHDEALEDHARQHRALSPRGEPVRSPAPASFFVGFPPLKFEFK